MAEAIQCDSCGAVLLKEDIFCGECGAPRPALNLNEDSAAVEPATGAPPAQTPDPQPAAAPAPSRSPETGWRIAMIVLLILGACFCLAGMSTFLLFGLTESDATTRQEDWLYATFLCLLPLAGMGAILALTGAGIWFSRLRKR